MESKKTTEANPSEKQATNPWDEIRMVEVPGEGFRIAEYPVTQKLWESVMGGNPSEVKDPNAPVTNVDLYEADEFCSALSTETGRRFRLPSADEWLRTRDVEVRYADADEFLEWTFTASDSHGNLGEGFFEGRDIAYGCGVECYDDICIERCPYDKGPNWGFRVVEDVEED